LARPFALAQALENERFLETLLRTGNARLAARGIGRAFSTLCHRRTAHAEFAQAWEAAVVAAHARFHLAGGKRGPEGSLRTAGGREKKLDSRFRGNDWGGGSLGCAQDDREGRDRALDEYRFGSARGGSGRPGLRTLGGEPVVVRTRNGKLQLRQAHPGKLTKTAEQVFLAALSATANIRLSAAAAGASPAAFYRRRKQSPAFDREFRLSLKMGYERLEAEALRAAMPESHADDEWREIDPPAIPPMSADQALQLLFLHEKSVQQGWDLPHRRRRRGETDEVYTERLRAMWTCEKRREAEDDALRRALRFEKSGEWRFEDEARPLPLPPLEQVTGWSKAAGKAPHDPDVALFGGWRIGHMERALERRRRG
jgi:hypothetical protein